MGPAIGRFLKAVSRLAKNKDITIEEAYKFAKQEFGEVSDLLKLQINKIFKTSDAPSIKKPKKEGEVIEAVFKPGKSKYSDKVIEESPSQASGLESLKNPFRSGGGLDQVTGITRALARRILDRKGIEIGKKDPIDAFINTFGEAITDVKNLAEEMIEIDARGGGMKDMDQMLEIEGLFDIPVPKSPSKGLTDKEMLDLMEEAEQEDILKKFDPKDREPNAMGGINRTNFAIGAFSKATILIQRLKNTLKSYKGDNSEMGKYVNETFPNFIKEIEANPQLADNPKVAEAFGITDLGEASGKQRLVEYEDGSLDFFTKGSKKGMDSTKQLSDELGISMEEAIKIKQMEPEDQVLEINRRRRLLDKSRTKNAEGGLNYLMGM